jgi:hypothetical protein
MRCGARRPTGAFAEALLAVPPSGADPAAAAPVARPSSTSGRPRVEDNIDLEVLSETAPERFGTAVFVVDVRDYRHRRRRQSGC